MASKSFLIRRPEDLGAVKKLGADSFFNHGKEFATFSF
jgi:hypothetical protein